MNIKSKNAIRWLEALLSDKYNQSKSGYLKDENGYCCWGVGCAVLEIPFEEGVTAWEDSLSSKIGFLSTTGSLSTSLYTEKFLDVINDHTPANFGQIARHLIKYAHLDFEPKVGNDIQEYFKPLIQNCKKLTKENEQAVSY